MADTFDHKTRSEIMRKVKSERNKSTELRLIDLFEKYHITGWRRHYNVKGHPDFVFPEKKIAVFVDGCFWHGHNCRNTKPADHADYWKKKQERNIRRDQEINQLFIQRHWTVIRIWECELKKKNESMLIDKLKIIKELKRPVLA